MGRDLFALRPATAWVARRVDIHAALDSTNVLADALAHAGAADGTLVVADRQTDGRGRLGRTFFSPGGRSLYASLVLRPTCAPDAVSQHIFAAANAVAGAVAQVLGPETDRVQIKWPNDVQIDGQKVSGINLPGHVHEGRVAHAILGIGVNVNTRRSEFPEELQTLATSLFEATGEEQDRVGFAEDLLLRLEAEIDLLRSGRFAAVLDRWRSFFAHQGAHVRIGGPGVPQPVEGTIEGIDADGALLLNTARGHERILAGDVTVLRAPSPRSSDQGSSAEPSGSAAKSEAD